VAGVGNLKDEIKQERAFHSLEEQALLNLLRTADFLDRALEHKIRPFGITSTQYNVLRILRGAHPQGLTCSAIGDRMITAEPDVTRLLSRLRNLKFVRQHRDRNDRRVLWTQISPQGLKLLGEMDPMIEQGPIELLGHLQREDLERLIALLEAARGGSGQPTCDGRSSTRPAPAPSDRADPPPDRLE
jgi:DNA-binding MarR family transcriptional regulator